MVGADESLSLDEQALSAVVPLSASSSALCRLAQTVRDECSAARTNRFAHAAALAVAELPGQAYNPLFLYVPRRR